MINEIAGFRAYSDGHSYRVAEEFGVFKWKHFVHPNRCKLTGVLFSALFSLSKFQAYEAREAVLVKQQLNTEGVT